MDGGPAAAHSLSCVSFLTNRSLPGPFSFIFHFVVGNKFSSQAWFGARFQEALSLAVWVAFPQALSRPPGPELIALMWLWEFFEVLTILFWDNGRVSACWEICVYWSPKLSVPLTDMSGHLDIWLPTWHMLGCTAFSNTLGVHCLVKQTLIKFFQIWGKDFNFEKTLLYLTSCFSQFDTVDILGQMILCSRGLSCAFEGV